MASPIAIIPPVDVPEIRSKWSTILLRVARSISAKASSSKGAENSTALNTKYSEGWTFVLRIYCRIFARIHGPVPSDYSGLAVHKPRTANQIVPFRHIDVNSMFAGNVFSLFFGLAITCFMCHEYHVEYRVSEQNTNILTACINI